MSTLLAWVMAASAVLAPGRSHERLAEAIATRALAEPPLFKDDDDRRKTSALLVAIAFRESSLRSDAVGDFAGSRPTSFCAFQLHLPGTKTKEGWSGADLAADPDKCVTVAMRLLRDSMRSCPTHPIAWYAAGPSGCGMVRAQRISRDRVLLAQRLMRDVAVPAEEAPTKALETGREEPTKSDEKPQKKEETKAKSPSVTSSRERSKTDAKAGTTVALLDDVGACAPSWRVGANGHDELFPWQDCALLVPVSRAGPMRMLKGTG